jgi:hypothetical protein
MVILNPKVKRLQNKTLLLLGSLSVFAGILFLSACENKKKRAEDTLLANISEKDTVLSSVKVKIKTYYKLNQDLSDRVKQAEEYLISDKVAFRINFSETGVNWKDLDIKNFQAFQNCFPLFENRLGFELFMSNCLQCHTTYPNASDKGICVMFRTVKNRADMVDFLNNPLTDSVGTLRHPSFQYLDTLEIRNICTFLEKSCSGSVTNTKE